MKTWKAATALTAVIILAGLNAGCTRAADVHGTVSELEIEPQKKVCSTPVAGSKATPKCTVTGVCYEIEVTDVDGFEHDFCLTKSAWERFRVGDKYPAVVGN